MRPQITVRTEHLNLRFLFNAIIYSCQGQGKIVGWMSTLSDPRKLFLHLCVFTETVEQRNLGCLQPTGFLMGYDTVTVLIILKLMSNLGCYGDHAGMDDQHQTNYVFCSLARI